MRCGRSIAAAEGSEADVALLRGVPIFGPLPAATVEHLARRLVPRTVVAGEVVFHEGDHGDRFYVVRRGPWTCCSRRGRRSRARAHGSVSSRSSRRAAVGDGPRREDSELVALERDDILRR